MKKLLIISLALLFLGAMALPASAFVFVFADVEKTKDVTVTETITITKTATINATVNLPNQQKASETLALVNQENFGNEGCENCAEKTALIDGEPDVGSVNNNVGIIHVNQATGNQNNQGNVIALGYNGGDDKVGGFANAESSVAQHQGHLALPDDTIKMLVDDDGDPDTPPVLVGDDNDFPDIVLDGNLIKSQFIIFREAFIRGSIKDNEGVVGVNQTSGHMNNQANSVSLAVTLGGVALSEADLGQATGISNAAWEDDTLKTAEITGSILGNFGVIGVNNSSGSMANQSNNVSMAAALDTVPSLPTAP